MRSRRDQVLDHAIASGKFGEERRAHWAQQYDADPAGTERWIAAMWQAGPTDAYPPELFPHLNRAPRSFERTSAHARAVPVQAHASPAPPAAETTATLTPELVGAWSRQLFPEVGAEGPPPRIVRAND